MVEKIKKLLYFPIASYFKFFANIRLRRWNPKIVVVTGSSGKTTLLHLLESQLGDKARYSHHANSSFGIPFDILGLRRESLLKTEWVNLFLNAPFSAFKALPKEKIYVIETDCDRPNEGKFLAAFLKPTIVLWLNVSRTHSMNFDTLVDQKKFPSVEEAIAYEYGYFLEYCKEQVILNGDSDLIIKQISRTKAKVEKVTKKELKKYEVSVEGTRFIIDNVSYKFNILLPEDTIYSIQAAKQVVELLSLEYKLNFPNFSIPPGRSSLFNGVKDTIIVDSSYNANLNSMSVILDMFEQIYSPNKWAILSDMLEQGKNEQEEHEKLADHILQMDLKRILLMGPRVSKYTYPKVKSASIDSIIVEKFATPKEVLEYLLQNLEGKELLLFKGARFLEGVIEHLLVDKNDIKKLCRREKIWEIRRKQWGL